MKIFSELYLNTLDLHFLFNFQAGIVEGTVVMTLVGIIRYYCYNEIKKIHSYKKLVIVLNDQRHGDVINLDKKLSKSYHAR